MYKIKWNALRVRLVTSPGSLSEVPPSQLLYALNESIVGLCVDDTPMKGHLAGHAEVDKTGDANSKASASSSSSAESSSYQIFSQAEVLYLNFLLVLSLCDFLQADFVSQNKLPLILRDMPICHCVGLGNCSALFLKKFSLFVVLGGVQA